MTFKELIAIIEEKHASFVLLSVTATQTQTQSAPPTVYRD
jgi:hypothetical protein